VPEARELQGHTASDVYTAPGQVIRAVAAPINSYVRLVVPRLREPDAAPRE